MTGSSKVHAEEGGREKANEVESRPPRKEKKVYTCKYCFKTFKRSEHCKRHQRSHTLERPFGCRYCGRVYARKDLVVRHERTLHADVYPSNDPREFIENVNPRTQHSKWATVVQSPGGQTFRDGPNNYLPPTHGSTYGTPWQPDVHHIVPDPCDIDDQHPQSNTNNGDISVKPDDPIDPSLSMHNPSSTSPGQKWYYDSTKAGGTSESKNILHQIEAPYPSAPTALSQAGTSPDVYQPSMDASGQMQEGLGHFNDVNFFELFPDDFPGMDLSGLTPSGNDMNTPLSNPAERQNFLRKHSYSAVSPGAASNAQDDGESNFNTLPKVVKEPREMLPLFTLDDHKRAMIMNDIVLCLEGRQRNGQFAPNAASLQKFVNSYFSSFHPHLPIFHLPSFKINDAPNPLVLSICAIGALYRLERNIALQLYEIAWQTCEATSPPAQFEHNLGLSHSSPSNAMRQVSSTRLKPIWFVQSKLLLLFFAMFSGDPVLVRSGTERLGILSTEYRKRLLCLCPKMRRKKEPTWQEWIERETSKRVMYAIFIMSSLISITYGVPPGVVLMQDAELEMPDDESLWNAKTADEWLRAFNARKTLRNPSINEALGRLMYGKESEDCAPDTWEWSPYATLIVMHAVAVHMWTIMQASQSFNLSILSDANEQDMLKSLFCGQIDKALTRCHILITRARPENENTWIESEYPLLFNCLALLRISYVKAFTSTAALNRMIILSDKESEVVFTIKSFVASKQTRSDLITKAVNQAFEGLLIPMKAGRLLIRKTAALSWSIEHAIAAWDCALFFTKWVHSIECEIQVHAPVEAKELETITEVQNLLQESGDAEPSTSLAGQVTRLWSSFLDDTWVWGVTPRMSALLCELAAAYDEDWNVRVMAPG